MPCVMGPGQVAYACDSAADPEMMALSPDPNPSPNPNPTPTPSSGVVKPYAGEYMVPFTADAMSIIYQ